MIYKYHDDPHDPASWTRYVIDSNVGEGLSHRSVIKFIKSTLKEKLLRGFTSGAHYTAIADINGDRRDDLIVAGDHMRYDVIWYKAPENITNTSTWQKYALYQNDSHQTYHVEAGDIMGDGDIDIVFATKTDNGVGWLENNGSLVNWLVTWIDTNCTRAFNVRVADLDKDGKNDVITSEDCTDNGGILHLYSYLGDPRIQENWIDHRIANFPKGEGVNVFEIVDIDSDGDLDIVTGNHQGDIYVLQNPYPSNVDHEWERYKVSNNYPSREVDVADIDSDGDLDIIIAEYNQNQIVWFENNGTTFYSSWEKHIADKSDKYLNWCHHVELSDIDGDGYFDIAVAAADSNTFLLYFKINKVIDE